MTGEVVVLSSVGSPWCIVRLDGGRNHTVACDVDPGRDAMPAVARTRRGAVELLEDDGDRVVGPYVLAERVRQR